MSLSRSPMATYALQSHGEPVSHALPECVPVRPREGTEASSPDAQTTLMEMVGFFESADSYSLLEPVLTSSDGEILSITSRRFTELKTSSLHQKSLLVSSLRYVPAEERDSKVDIAALVEKYPPVCMCPAHVAFRESSNEFFCNCIGRLVPILTDHFGGELVESLLPSS